MTKTTACNECEGEIPATAARCMHCGQAQKKTSPAKALGIVAIVAFGVWMVFSAINGQKQAGEEADRKVACTLAGRPSC